MSIDIDCLDYHPDNGFVTVFQTRLPAAIRVNSVGQMVTLIEQRLGGQHMRRLRIFGHGIPGAQGLGNSFNLYNTNLYNQITIGSDSRLMYGNILGRLRPLFARGGWAELHGCSVGAGAAGWNLLKGLAALWQVNVAAGVVTQYSRAGFEGAYRVAHPNGRVEWRRGH